jgi:hypothetical protein
MKRSVLNVVYEPDCMTAEASSGYPDVPVGWFMVLDCEGGFVCAVPPGKGLDPRDPAQTIARALNFAWEKAQDDVY